MEQKEGVAWMLNANSSFPDPQPGPQSFSPLLSDSSLLFGFVQLRMMMERMHIAVGHGQRLNRGHCSEHTKRTATSSSIRK